MVCNRMLRGRQLRAAAPMAAPAQQVLVDALARGSLTMRGAERVRALALTLADLAGDEPPLDRGLVEQALALRGGESMVGSWA